MPPAGLTHVSAIAWSAGPAVASSAGGAIVHVAASSGSVGPVSYYRSLDGGLSFERPVIHTPAGTGAYTTALASGAGGLVVIAWTAPTGAGVHGVFVTRSSDYGTSWSSPTLVSHGNVQIFGVAVASDGSARFVVSWWDAAGGVLLRLSRDGAGTFGPPTSIGTASQALGASLGAAFAFSSGSLLATWRTPSGAIVLRRSGAAGTGPWTAPVTLDTASAGFAPVLATRGSAVAVAYTVKIGGKYRAVVKTSTDGGLHWSGKRMAPTTSMGEGVTGLVVLARGQLQLVTMRATGPAAQLIHEVFVVPTTNYGLSWGRPVRVSDSRYDSWGTGVARGNRTLALISTNHDPSWATFQVTLDLARY